MNISTKDLNITDPIHTHTTQTHIFSFLFYVETIPSKTFLFTQGQTVFGKTPMGVLQTAQQYHVPVIGIAGCLGDNADAMIKQGMTAIFPIIPGIATLDQVLSQAAINLTNTSANIAALMKLSMSLNHDISGDKNLKQAKP